MLNNIASPTYATASITRDSALSLIVAARHAARDLGINVAIAVTDAGGHLTAFERADATPFLAAEVAINKAWTASSFGLSTRVVSERCSRRLPDDLIPHQRVMAVGGGVPAVVGGRVVGAIGVSGGNAQQDHDVAVAALEAVGMSSSSQSDS